MPGRNKQKLHAIPVSARENNPMCQAVEGKVTDSKNMSNTLDESRSQRMAVLSRPRSRVAATGIPKSRIWSLECMRATVSKCQPGQGAGRAQLWPTGGRAPEEALRLAGVV